MAIPMTDGGCGWKYIICTQFPHCVRKCGQFACQKHFRVIFSCSMLGTAIDIRRDESIIRYLWVQKCRTDRSIPLIELQTLQFQTISNWFYFQRQKFLFEEDNHGGNAHLITNFVARHRTPAEVNVQMSLFFNEHEKTWTDSVFNSVCSLHVLSICVLPRVVAKTVYLFVTQKNKSIIISTSKQHW